MHRLKESAIATENELLEEVPLPGVPVTEQERRQKWLQIPRAARIAIRRLHQEFGHVSRAVLVELLKASKAPPEYVTAARSFVCNDCNSTKPNPQSKKVALPRPYIFNHAVSVDVLDLHDADGKNYAYLSILCLGTKFHVVVCLGQIEGVPTSQACLDAFNTGWVGWAGWPTDVVCDRGLHNRGAFAKQLGAVGISISQIGFESPEQLGSGERHGGLWKDLARRVVTARKLVGESQMTMLSAEVTSIKNEQSRHGGFAPCQWVIGKLPRRPGDQFDEDSWADLGILSEKLDADGAFALQQEIRTAARRAFVKIDCGKRVARALLRKSAPLPGKYSVGDLISFKREQKAKTDEQRWSTAARIIGFDGEKVCWCLCEGVPFCVATDKIRPATSAQALAYLYLNKDKHGPVYTPGPSDEQQSFVDARSRDPETQMWEHPELQEEEGHALEQLQRTITERPINNVDGSIYQLRQRKTWSKTLHCRLSLKSLRILLWDLKWPKNQMDLIQTKVKIR